MVRKRQRGFTVAEIVVTIFVLGLLLLSLTRVQAELMKLDARMRIRWMSHPEQMAVVARLRKDILDSTSYPSFFDSYVQSSSTLILSSFDEEDESQIIIYDLSESQIVHRRTFKDGEQTSDWIARGVPNLQFSGFDMPGGTVAVRVFAFNDEGNLIIDQVFQPRSNS